MNLYIFFIIPSLVVDGTNPGQPSTGVVISGTYGGSSSRSYRHSDFYMERIRYCADRDDYQSILSNVAGYVQDHNRLDDEHRSEIFSLFKMLIDKHRNEKEFYRDLAARTSLGLDAIAGSPNSLAADFITRILDKIDEKMRDMCDAVGGLLDSLLIPLSKDRLTRLYYMLLRADYLRYRAEMTPAGRQRSGAGRIALDMYDNVYSVATVSGGLPANHWLILKILFHKSILQHDILADLQGALHTCTKAMDDASKVNSGVFSLIWPSSWSEDARMLLDQIQRTYESWSPLVVRGNGEDCLSDEWVVCDKK